MINLIFFTIISFCSSYYFSQKVEKPKVVISKQQNAINFNTHFLALVSLGNKRMMTDWLWIQTLLESDEEHYKEHDLNNWLYLRFDTISKLDPKFLEVYQYGGQYLSVIKDDDWGAKEIYDRGLQVYPDDYYLIWNTAFHYLYELNDEDTAVKLFEKILYHPRSPGYLSSIVAKIKSSKGDRTLALHLMEEGIRRLSDKNLPLKSAMEFNLKSLKIEIDLECLNAGKSDCKLHRPEGFQYIIQNGVYTTDKPYKKFKLFLRGNKQ